MICDFFLYWTSIKKLKWQTKSKEKTARTGECTNVYVWKCWSVLIWTLNRNKDAKKKSQTRKKMKLPSSHLWWAYTPCSCRRAWERVGSAWCWRCTCWASPQRWGRSGVRLPRSPFWTGRMRGCWQCCWTEGPPSTAHKGKEGHSKIWLTMADIGNNGQGGEKMEIVSTVWFNLCQFLNRFLTSVRYSRPKHLLYYISTIKEEKKNNQKKCEHVLDLKGVVLYL